MRTGTDYLAALKDDREAYIDGQRVRDVASHPAFAPIAAAVAGLFDLAADPAAVRSRPGPGTPTAGSGAARIISAPSWPGSPRTRRCSPPNRMTWPRTWSAITAGY